MGFISNLISTVGKIFTPKKKETLGEVIVKPSEVGQLSQGTRYSVPETGVSGVAGGKTTQGTSNTMENITLQGKSIVSQGNIQQELANVSKTFTGEQLQPTQQPKIDNQTRGIIREGNTMTDEELMAISPTPEGRPMMINSLTGKPMMAPQLTEAEAAVGSPYNIKSSLTSMGGASLSAAIPAILSSASAALSSLQALFTRIGAQASTTAGAKALASTAPEAAGVASKTIAGEVAVNTATKATGIQAISNILRNNKLLTAGAIISMGWQTGEKQTTTRKDISSYIKDSGELAVKLRQAGMNEEADQLYENNKDLLDGIDTIIPYIPLIGKVIEENKIQKYRDELSALNNKYEELQIEQAKQKVLDDRAYKEQQLQEQRRYDEARLAEARAYAESQKEEERRYQEEQAAKESEAAEAEALRAEALATESLGGSTLNFGILGSGGDIEYVDINKAAQYYYGKPYEELTPAQIRLLMLAKGKIK